MTDHVAEFLLKENFLLTALEFYQELLETGRTNYLLKQFFEEHRYIEPNSNSKKDGTTGMGSIGSSALSPKSANPPSDLVSNAATAALQDELQKKDKQISILNYEMSIAKEEIEKLKGQLRESFVLRQQQQKENAQKSRKDETSDSTITSAPSNSPQQNGENEDDDADADLLKKISENPIKEEEKQVINYLLKQYLTQNGYKISAISFSDEVGNADFFDMSNVMSQEDIPLGLLYLYRYYYQLPTRSKQKMKDTNALQKALQKVEEKQKLIDNFEKSIRQQEKELQNVSNKKKVLETENKKLKEELHQMKTTLNSIQISSEPVFNPMADASSGVVDTNASAAAPSSSQPSTATSKPSSVSSPTPPKTSTSSTITSPSSTSSKPIPTNATSVTTPVVEDDDDDDEETELSPVIAKDLPSTKTGLQREISLLKAKLEEHESKEKNIVHVLGETIPNLIKSVKAAKRDEFMPIILAVITQHGDVKVRDTLSAALFNLIKRPDDAQREAILNGCISLARKISPERFENELLPQCWEQISHKFPERRMLVADACGILATYIKPALRSSLLFSMLGQLLEDRSEMVRQCVVTNLAKLLASFEDASKYAQVEEAFFACLFDFNDLVVKLTIEQLVPAVFHFSSDYNCIFNKLLPSIWQRLETSCFKLTVQKQYTAAPNVILLLETLVTGCKYVYQKMLDTVPEAIIKKYGNSNSDAKDKNKQTAFLKFLKSNFDNIVDRMPTDDTFEGWKDAEYVIKKLIPRLMSVVISLDVAEEKIFSVLYKLLLQICQTFGEEYTNLVVKAFFLAGINGQIKLEFVPDYEDHIEDPENNVDLMIRGRLLPVFLRGVLPCTGDLNEFTQYIKDTVISIAIKEKGWAHRHIELFEHAYAQACKSPQLQEELISIVWELVLHPATSVRSFVVRLFTVMMEAVDSKSIAVRIFPAMLTLASDPDKDIRLNVLRGLGDLVVNIQESKDFDKVGNQFEQFMQDGNREIVHEGLRVYAKIIPQVDAYFRDTYILKRIYQTADENNKNPDQKDRKIIASILLDCFRALDGVPTKKDNIAQYILPGLVLLENDAKVLLDPSVRGNIKRMINELRAVVPSVVTKEEAAAMAKESAGNIAPVSNPSIIHTSTTTTPSTASGITTKPEEKKSIWSAFTGKKQ